MSQGTRSLTRKERSRRKIRAEENEREEEERLNVKKNIAAGEAIATEETFHSKSVSVQSAE